MFPFEKFQSDKTFIGYDNQEHAEAEAVEWTSGWMFESMPELAEFDVDSWSLERNNFGEIVEMTLVKELYNGYTIRIEIMNCSYDDDWFYASLYNTEGSQVDELRGEDVYFGDVKEWTQKALIEGNQMRII